MYSKGPGEKGKESLKIMMSVEKVEKLRDTINMKTGISQKIHFSKFLHINQKKMLETALCTEASF